MSIVKDFKNFAMKGNVVDMAVGVVIGAAFAKIVTSFVDNIIMPPLNLITAKAGLSFNQLALKVPTEAPVLGEDGKPVLDAEGAMTLEMQDYPVLQYGPLLQTIVEFLLVAIAIFIAVRLMNKAKEAFEKEEEEEKKTKEPAEDILLLREIRDRLSN